MPKLKEIQYVVNNCGCHICTSHSLDTYGYPKVTRGGVMVKVAKHLYTKTKGDIPKGMVLRHTCDNRRCVNPDHLILGTQADNINDMVARGRLVTVRGEQQGSAKLTNSQVLEILDSDEKQVFFVKKFKISPTVVSMIRRGVIWKHLKKKLD